MEVFEELAQADASVAWCVWNGNTHWTAAQLSPEAARTIHDDPDVITANSTRASGQAHVVDGGYRVTGRWSLVSGCELAAWMVLLCVVHEDGKPRLTPAGVPGDPVHAAPATECEIIDTWTVGGLRGTGSHDVAVHDVFVPIDFGSGFSDPYVLPEPRYRIPPFSRVIPGLGAMALGIARTAIETLQRDRRREDTAADDPDAARQSWRTGSGVAGGITRAFGAALSVRQPGSAVAHADRDGRGHDGGAGACSAGRIACRFQRGAGG